MSYSGFKEDLLDFITAYEMNLINDPVKCFIFTSRDIYDLYDGCESTKDASDALNSLWKYDGELARIEVSKIDKELIADRESVPNKGYFYALAGYAPTGFEMHEKFKLPEKKEIKSNLTSAFDAVFANTAAFNKQEIIDKNTGSKSGKINLNMNFGITVPSDLIDNKTQKETEMNNEEKEYAIAVWSREFEGAKTCLYRALNNPSPEFSNESFEDVEEYMAELRRLQDEYANRYRMAKKQLEALK